MSLISNVMKASLAVLGAAFLACSCVHSTKVSHTLAPSIAPAMQRQILNAVDAGEGDVAVRELRRRITADSGDIEARLDLAARYQQQGFSELAIEHYRLAADKAPHLSGVRMLLAKALHAVGDDSEAVDTLDNFCKIDPLPPVDLLSVLGIYEDELGRYTDAEAHHRAAVARDPARGVPHNNLGYNLLLQGRVADALAELRQAVRLAPRSDTARNNLGTALALAGNHKEALLEWQSISSPAAAHSNLASVLIEQGRFAEARGEIAIALGFSGAYPAALTNLALIAELDGKPAAVQAQERVTTARRVALALRKALLGAKQETGAGSEPVRKETGVTAGKVARSKE